MQGLWASLIISVVIAACIPLCSLYFDVLGLGGAGASVVAVRVAGDSYLRWMAGGSLPLVAAGVAAAAYKGIGEMRTAVVVTGERLSLIHI